MLEKLSKLFYRGIITQMHIHKKKWEKKENNIWADNEEKKNKKN